MQTHSLKYKIIREIRNRRIGECHQLTPTHFRLANEMATLDITHNSRCKDNIHELKDQWVD